jgi:ABC-2 type transport system permease protein
MNLLKSEFRKLIYQRSTYGLILAAIAISVLATALSPYAVSKLGNAIVMPLSNADNIDGIYAKSLGSYMFIVIVGVLMMAGEFHHHTAVATFLAAPKRLNVLLAKIGMAAIAGAVIDLIATWIGIASGAFALTFYPKAAQPHDYIFLNFSASAALTGAVLAVVGVGIGALIRNQNLAVTASLIWLFVVDRILSVVWVEVGKYLPTGLITAMMNLKIDVTTKSPISINTADYLDPIPAAFLLLGYGIVFALVSLVFTLRRDID